MVEVGKIGAEKRSECEDTQDILGRVENVQILVVVKMAQLYEYAKNH